MLIKKTAIACALFGALVAQSQAANIVTDGSWNMFDVDNFSATSGGTEWIDVGSGSPLTFEFTIGAGFKGLLTVVDGVFAGDTFNVFNNGLLLGATSAVPVTNYENDPTNAGFDFDAALADSAFSRGVFTLGAGTYSISGVLAQSVLFGGDPLNATSGALRVEVSAVPEPSSILSLLAGLGLMGATMRRRFN